MMPTGSKQDSDTAELEVRIVSDDPSRLRERLVQQAHLFDDPGSYRAGVEDAFAVLRPAVDGADGPVLSLCMAVGPQDLGAVAALSAGLCDHDGAVELVLSPVGALTVAEVLTVVDDAAATALDLTVVEHGPEHARSRDAARCAAIEQAGAPLITLVEPDVEELHPAVVSLLTLAAPG